MKKLLLLLCVISIVACKQEPKDYVTLSGKITNQNSDSLFVYQGRDFSKTIKVNQDGTFSDTLKVTSGMYSFYDGSESSSLYLKNGYDLNLTLDTKEFDETIKYSGNGEESNNYLAAKSLLQEKLFEPSMFDLKEGEFKTKIESVKNELSSFLTDAKDLDLDLIVSEKTELEEMSKGLMSSYKRQKQRANQYASFIGKPSPSFDNYENYKGGTTSLSDLKGKYVYVDVWATWCGPCKREIPFLKETEEAYHGKNIEFVSISVDEGRGYKGDMAAAKEGWKKMIAEKELGGIQLLSDKAWKSDFIQGFKINGIPRFILIGPEGNVVNADAPRPSSPKLKELLNSLSI
jgi:thiol-disulfide isomerase/thioredoxin